MMKILGGFVHERGRHSDTASLRDVFGHAGCSFPEPFYFGIGEGLGFYYRNGGAAGPLVGGPPVGGRIGYLELDRRVCQNLNARLEVRTSTSSRRAQEALISRLDAGRPAMLHVDTYYLKFLRRPVHYGAHSVVVAGVDEGDGLAYVADRSSDRLVPVPLPELAEARASAHRPFPPHNRWFEIDVPAAVAADRKTVMGAIGRNATEMLNSVTRNVGIGGIYYFATCLQSWKSVYNTRELGTLCQEAHDAIEGDGTGGGFFRNLYADFLHYTGATYDVPALSDVADGYRRVGRLWTQAAKMLLEVECGCASLAEASQAVSEIAAREHELQVSLMTAANLCCRRK